MKRFFSFLLGAIVGSTLGAILALLVTPYSGEELRAQAREASMAKRIQMEARLRELRGPRPAAPASEKPQ
jgi:gas vesicle protein